MITLLSGLAAGSAHVVSGPDHLAALAPLAAHRPGRAAATGAIWGLGHGLGVLVIAGAGHLAKDALPIELMSAWSEFLVGVLLVVIGLWAFRTAARIVVHAHAHDHAAADEHAHGHVHVGLSDHAAAEAHAGHSHASFWIGALHGAAGTGHLLGVLPSLALPPAEAVVFLGAYFAAAIASMTLFGLFMGRVVRVGGMRTMRTVMYGAATAAVALGVVWMGTAWPGV